MLSVMCPIRTHATAGGRPLPHASDETTIRSLRALCLVLMLGWRDLPPQCARPNVPQSWRRRPEQTLWYRIVQTHLETWLELASGEDGEAPPAHVERTFRRYLECGILAHGFARAYCDKCQQDFLIAYS